MGLNRRTFIRSASLAAAGSAAGLRPFGALNALAQTHPGYKALVCVFLFGGNDANNTLIQFDTNGYANYASIRGPLALPQNQLLQLGAAPNFALNPNLPDIQSLFNNNAAAIVTNVGTLIQPTTAPVYSRPEPAHQSLLPPRPAARVAECRTERRHPDRLGRPHRRHPQRHATTLTPPSP